MQAAALRTMPSAARPRSGGTPGASCTLLPIGCWAVGPLLPKGLAAWPGPRSS